jgi:hypothetical protein
MNLLHLLLRMEVDRLIQLLQLCFCGLWQGCCCAANPNLHRNAPTATRRRYVRHGAAPLASRGKKASRRLLGGDTPCCTAAVLLLYRHYTSSDAE